MVLEDFLLDTTLLLLIGVGALHEELHALVVCHRGTLLPRHYLRQLLQHTGIVLTHWE